MDWLSVRFASLIAPSHAPVAARSLRVRNNIDTDRVIKEMAIYGRRLRAGPPTGQLRLCAAVESTRVAGLLVPLHLASSRPCDRRHRHLRGRCASCGWARRHLCLPVPARFTERGETRPSHPRRLALRAQAASSRCRALRRSPRHVHQRSRHCRWHAVLGQPGLDHSAIVGFAECVASRWRHSEGCFDSAHLRMLTCDDRP
jgi:hypothetical protein